MAGKLKVLISGRFLNEDFTAGTVVEVESDERYTQLAAMQVQIAATMGKVFEPITDGELASQADADAEAAAEKTDAPPTREALEAMKFEDLRALAKARELTGYKKMSATELVEALAPALSNSTSEQDSQE